MATYQTVKEIEQALNRGLTSVAKDDYFINRLKIELRRAINDKVYIAPPGSYVRRYDSGGLGDKTNMDSSWENGGDPGSGWQSLGDDDFLPLPGEVESGAGNSSTITITLEDYAPLNPYGGNGAIRSTKNKIDDNGNEIIDEGSGRLAYYVENGIGKGKMSIPRPFYKYADDYVTEDSEMLSNVVAQILNKNL